VLSGHPELIGPMWSWGIDTSTHALRLVFGGVFDRFPTARLLLGHMGEGLPFVLWRLDSRWNFHNHHGVELARAKPSEYLRENLYIVTSGACSPAPLLASIHALGADHILDSRRPDLAAEVMRLTSGAGADLVLESAGGATFEASLAAAKRVTGRVIVYGTAGGEAPVTNWELIYQHQVQVTGLNIGMLIQAAPQIYGELMGELFTLIAAGVLTPGQPVTYDLADGPKALAELETRATVGKLALLP